MNIKSSYNNDIRLGKAAFKQFFKQVFILFLSSRSNFVSLSIYIFALGSPALSRFAGFEVTFTG